MLRHDTNETHAARRLQRTNWSQGLEEGIDSSYICWLHRDLDPGAGTRQPAGAQLTADAAPNIELRRTPYGFIYGARRDHDGQYQWRVTRFLLPTFSLICRAPGGYRSGALFPPRMAPGPHALPDQAVIDSWLPVAARESDCQLSRQMRRTVNFSGIWGVQDQDRALAENSRDIGGGDPGIADRSAEHLVSSDRAVLAARRILINLAGQLSQGREPGLPHHPGHYAVCAISKLSPITDLDDFLAEYGHEVTANQATMSEVGA